MRPYIELLRPPNLATAAADILAGYAVAGLSNPAALPWLILAAICLYGGGVVLNDYFDRAVDAVERPERPIPSGRVSAAAASRFGFGLLGAGVLLAAVSSPISALVASLVALFVLLYDAGGKHPLSMGMCRAFNLILGMSAVPAAIAQSWWLAFLPLVYILGITVLSRGEVHGGNRATVLFSLLCVLSVLAGALVLTLSPGHRYLTGIILVVFFGWRILPPFVRAYNDAGPAVIRQAVKTGVLSLVFLDAVIASAYGGSFYGWLVLTIALVAGALARKFAVT